MKSLECVESLIFDIDGTLWDSRELVAQGYNRELIAQGYSERLVDAQLLKGLFGKTMRGIADALFPDLPVPQRVALMERCMETEQRYLAQNPCDIGYPRVREILAQLAQDHRLFIVSNSQQGYPELCMEKLGIAPLFSGHLCFGDTGTEKGETIRRLCRAHNVQRAVYIGDTQTDCDAAREAGIPFVWASYGFGTVNHCEARIADFSELLELFPPRGGKA